MIANNKTAKRNGKAKGPPKKLRGATYIRMSSGKQEDSPERQRGDINAIPEFADYEVTKARQYDDHAKTGTTSKNRPAFLRMLADAEAGKFDAVFCSEQSRLTREDELDTLAHFKRLRDAGVRVFTNREGELDFGNLPGLLMMTINAHGNREESLKVAFRSTRGKYNAVLRDEWPSRAPFGLAKKFRDPERRKGGHLVPGAPAEIKIVRWCFRQYANTDTSFRELARDLNRRGVKTPNGNRWSQQTIRQILTRSCYKGMAAFNRTQQGQFHTMMGGQVVESSNRWAQKPESEWVYHKCNSLVSEELWDKVQTKMQANRKRTWSRGADTTTGSILSGIVKCGHCGRTMTTRTQASHGKEERVFICATYESTLVEIGERACNRNAIFEDRLRTFLIDRIQNDVLSDENLTRFHEKLFLAIAESNDSPDDEIKTTKRALKKLDSEVDRAVVNLRRATDDLYDVMADDLRAVKGRRDELASELAAIQKRKSGKRTAKNIADDAVAMLTRLRETLADDTISLALARETLNLLVDRIELRFTHSIIPGGTRVRSQFAEGTVFFHSTNLVHSRKTTSPRSSATSS